MAANECFMSISSGCCPLTWRQKSRMTQKDYRKDMTQESLLSWWSLPPPSVADSQWALKKSWKLTGNARIVSRRFILTLVVISLDRHTYYHTHLWLRAHFCTTLLLQCKGRHMALRQCCIFLSVSEVFVCWLCCIVGVHLFSWPLTFSVHCTTIFPTWTLLSVVNLKLLYLQLKYRCVSLSC